MGKSNCNVPHTKLGLNRKKTLRVAATPRVQNLRAEYWEKSNIEPENLISRRGRSFTGLDKNPCTWEQEYTSILSRCKVTVIGAISMKKVVALMTMNNSMDSQAFDVFIEKFLCLNCGQER